MSPPDRECSGMGNGRAYGVVQDRLNTGQGTTATVDQNRRMSSSFVNGNRKRSFSRNTTTYPNIKNTIQKKNKKKKKRRPTIGEILDPLYLEKKLASDNILNICENTHGRKFANGETGLRTTATCDAKNVMLEKEKIAKTDSETIATRDAKSVVLESDMHRTKTIDMKAVSTVEECTKVGNGVTGSSMIMTPLNGKGKKRKKPTIGENLNPRYLEELESAEANKGSAKKNKTELLTQKKKEAEGSNTHEETKDKETGKITPVVKSRKLLIFDVNGLLADIVHNRPKDCQADKYMRKRAIFRRPFLDDFLCFCFKRFHIGIWSSRAKKNLGPVVDFLLGNWKKKLLFLWDQSKCTNSWVKTLEDKHKCIVFKDLRKIWEYNGPNYAWVKGDFNESNTLLLDDSPYKALLNPKHTSVFPVTYSYTNKYDDGLGPKGDLRIYLEGLADAEDMKSYVEQHPFGQAAIDETSPHWAFYSKILECQKSKPIATTTKNNNNN